MTLNSRWYNNGILVNYCVEVVWAWGSAVSSGGYQMVRGPQSVSGSEVEMERVNCGTNLDIHIHTIFHGVVWMWIFYEPWFMSINNSPLGFSYGGGRGGVSLTIPTCFFR